MSKLACAICFACYLVQFVARAVSFIFAARVSLLRFALHVRSTCALVSPCTAVHFATQMLSCILLCVLSCVSCAIRPTILLEEPFRNASGKRSIQVGSSHLITPHCDMEPEWWNERLRSEVHQMWAGGRQDPTFERSVTNLSCLSFVHLSLGGEEAEIAKIRGACSPFPELRLVLGILLGNIFGASSLKQKPAQLRGSLVGKPRAFVTVVLCFSLVPPQKARLSTQEELAFDSRPHGHCG